ncbi:hypothetical protein [Salinispira pacifica]|uniref:Uncharacterized protein n=1 Tax=Salinispira pacifica TaxID=1307761 RepID=V5WNF9_9SPIO|nr:hypothetical protein [Salinispira pacifica]AHC16526.1 hypothetical protein L21SP2_3186 [Salinispira pacifica]
MIDLHANPSGNSGGKILRSVSAYFPRPGFMLGVLAAMLSIFPAGAWADQHVPSEVEESPVEFDLRAVFAPDTGRVDPLVELSAAFQPDSMPLGLSSLTAGAYLRVIDNLKLGAFYRMQLGSRHDDDWISDGAGGWSWADSSRRLEHLIIADATPRVLLPFLPGEDWVGGVKARYLYNFHNGQQSLYIRPGLTYVYLVRRSPVFNLSLAYAAGIGLNFSSGIYSHDLYANGLYHLSDGVKLELRLGWNRTTWETSADGREAGLDYRYSPDIFRAGAGIIFTPDLK